MAEVRLFGRIDADRELARLRDRPLNYDPGRREEHTEVTGWHIDDYAVRLPPEVPGPPIEGGPWTVACRLSKDYAFVDPSVVRAFYDRSDELHHRTMLIEVHFWGLRIYVGVRVGEVVDDEIVRDGRRARVFSWSYRTLERHFEMGEISYEVSKWLDSGEIDFRIHAYSRAADPANAVVRLGFRLFGRTRQIEFAKKACARMVAMTVAELNRGTVKAPMQDDSR